MDSMVKIRCYEPGAPDYPPALRRCSDGGGPPAVTVRGNLSTLDGTLTGGTLKTYDLARRLRETDVTVAGGFQSPMEKECLDVLLRGSASVIVCPARGLGRMRIPKGWRDPLAEGRLLILSFFDDRVRRATASTAVRRNACVAALADRILIAHAEKGGKIEALCKHALASGKPVFTLESADNAHLMELGARPVSADNPACLVTDRIDTLQV